jgi:hypothetical protein
MVADPATPKHLKLGALNSLAKLREAAGLDPEPAADPLGAMQQIVEEFCPQGPEDRELPADPMRGLDFEAFTGEKLDPVAASWLPYCPAPQVAQKAARRVVAASRRLGLGYGPYEEAAEDDELSWRRKRRSG